jgi:LuxR family maltose regulon positive regulatory protein
MPAGGPDNIRWFSPRLTTLLRKIGQSRAAIIEAASGYGKTTAGEFFMSEILPPEAGKIRCTCVKGSDRDAWGRFCSVIGEIDENAGLKMSGIGLPDEDTAGSAVYTLRGMSCPRETWLVLDDFQNLERAVPGVIWSEFLIHRPKNLRLLILTRQLFDERARYRAGFVRLDISDMALNEGEAREFFKARGVKVSRDEAKAVTAITAGCVQGLLLEMERYAETGKFHGLEDENAWHGIVRETIWKGLSPEQRDFLLRVSPFEAYTLRQAAYLLKSGDMPPRYALDASNNRAFVIHSAADLLYYPHSRILGFLRHELAQRGNLRAEALKNAAGWCIEAGDPIGAVNFYCVAGDFDGALSVDIRGFEMSRSGKDYEETTLAILKRSSPETKLRHPMHVVKHAFNLLDVGNREQFESSCAELGELTEKSGMGDAEKRRVFGELTFLSSFGEYNDIGKMAALMRKASELIGGEKKRPSLISMNDAWTFGNPSVLFMYHSRAGGLDTELADMTEGCEYYFALTGGHGSGGDELMKAEALFNRGEIGASEESANVARRIASRCAQTCVEVGVLLLLGRIAIHRGDCEALAPIIDDILPAIAKNDPLRSNRREADMAVSYLMELLGRADGVPDWSKSGMPDEAAVMAQAVPFAGILYGKYLMMEGRVTELASVLGEMRKRAAAWRSQMSLVYCEILSAGAMSAKGDLKGASGALRRALDLALPDRLYMPFAEHFESFSPTAETLAGSSSERELDKIRELAGELAEGRDAILRGMFHSIPFGLSPHEFKAVRLAAARRLNREIGEEMGLSENTVKQYLHSAFRKMRAAKRTDLAGLLDEASPGWRSQTFYNS